MSEDLRAIEKKILRGDILKALEVTKGQWVGALTLDQMLTSAGHDVRIPDIRLQCQYLAEKGYVEMKDTARKSMGLTIFMVRNTVKAQDLIEGSVPDDPGITLHD